MRTHAPSHNSIEQIETVSFSVDLAHTVGTDTEIDVFKVLFVDMDTRTRTGHLHRLVLGSADTKTINNTHSLPDKGVMVYSACCRYDNVAGSIMLLKVVYQLFPGKLFNVFLFSKNRKPERMALEVGRIEHLINVLFGIVLHHLDFLGYNVLFPFQIIILEQGVLVHVRENVEGQIRILPEYPCIKTGILLPGKGIHCSAHCIDFPRYVVCGTLPGPLEEHMFNKMGDPIALFCFEPPPCLPPHTQRDGRVVRN
ncbi:MAG: hypothetical protein A4E62_02142 [Syntrophorhabdus sp. PtaU1.Bin002]|nr:MAG: hypothetical protein A4E62_02142 [Syntrophorhabdus sp. PtaU1.Bin002]